MAQWELHERRSQWDIRRDGVLQLSTDIVRALRYVAEHVADDDVVRLRYRNGSSGPMMMGDGFRAMVARRADEGSS